MLLGAPASTHSLDALFLLSYDATLQKLDVHTGKVAAALSDGSLISVSHGPRMGMALL